MNDLKDYKNLGDSIIKNLSKIGITSYTQLKKIGATGVYNKLSKKYPKQTWPVCYYLCSIEGALTNKHWDKIGKKRKKQLLKAIGK